jgi:integrase
MFRSHGFHDEQGFRKLGDGAPTPVNQPLRPHPAGPMNHLQEAVVDTAADQFKEECVGPLHQLRHTHAPLLLRAGVPIPDMANRLGHANPGITLKVYSHAIKSDQAHTVAAVDRMLGGR